MPAMRSSSRLVIFCLLLVLALAAIGVGTVAVPVPYAALPLGSGLSLFLLDFMLVLPWYRAGRHRPGVEYLDRHPYMRTFYGDAPDDPFPTPPADHWGQYLPRDTPGTRWRHWDGGTPDVDGHE